MVDNINKNTICEILAKKNLNALNKLKNAEIKNKRLTLLNLFNNLLNAISTNNSNNNNNENESENEIKELNDSLGKMIGESKSFEEQIKLLKKTDYLNEYWNINYYDDNKEWNLKIFKAKFSYISNDISEKLFEKVFGHTFVTLADKLINTANKEENQIIINNI